MQWRVPLAEVCFGLAEERATLRVLRSGWVSMGPETELFEAEFAKSLNVKHAVAVSSGTAALHLAMLALGVGPGDEVILPSLTFVATANAVRYVGATPVFADITSEQDWNISPRDIERKITAKTRAVIVVHYGGFPCQMDRIRALANEKGIKVVEDAAHAPGGAFEGKKLGTWGDVGCFSFFSNKNMTTAEGGMALTDDDDAARLLRILRSHGMTSLTWDRHRGHNFSYDVIAMGFNYRIDEIRAALGRVQLDKLDEHNRRRREISRKMRSLLSGIEGLTVPFPGTDLDSSSCHIFPVLLESPELRQPFMRSMKDRGIQTSVHYPPVHSFSDFEHDAHCALPLTEEVAGRAVTLPLFPTMTAEQITLLCNATEACLREIETQEIRRFDAERTSLRDAPAP